MSRILITSALPYINGVKHLGVLAGSMLPADVYARFQRARGHEVLYICATDEHGTPTELAAARAGEDVLSYCEAMHERQHDLGRAFGLSWDWFGRSSSPQNHRLTQHFADVLEDNGLIEERTDRVVLGCAARVHGGEARQRLALRNARGNGRVDERGNERSAVALRPSDDQAAGRRVGYRDGRQPLGEWLDE